jgi:hypothetical protein
VTTFAPGQEARSRLRELEEQTRRAWDTYRDSLARLEGEEYEAAEQRCWDRLQRKLSEFDRERAEIATDTGLT